MTAADVQHYLQRHRLVALKTSLVPSNFVKREKKERKKIEILLLARKLVVTTFGSVEKVVKHGYLSTFLNKLLK